MDLRSYFGGNPIAVLLRLALISLVVGVVLAALGIDLTNFIYRFSEIVRTIRNLGYRSIDWVLQYTLLGALVVVPIWLIARLSSGFRSKQD